MKRTIVVSLALVLGFHWYTMSSRAQSGEKFKGRLSPVPALGIPAASVAGVGSASAVLSGRKLAVTGSFEKMASPATEAHLNLGPVTGVRGNPVFDLMVSKTGAGTTGTIAGSFDLTAEQVDALRKGKFYIQIHSEGAPNGHLFGWLLK
ncbi:MAG: CHRD domain-containing protein [Acidobacteria bacterium]|nr:CHRD domain-containing protein [Acidobacteriota bacterium]